MATYQMMSPLQMRFRPLAVLAVILLGTLGLPWLNGMRPLPPKLDPMKIPPLTIEEENPGGGMSTVSFGSRVTLRYVTSVPSGRAIDTTLAPKRPALEMEIGKDQVLPGLELGLLGMRKGGRRTFIVPPHLAYGSWGLPYLVPPNTAIRFQVEIIEIN